MMIVWGLLAAVLIGLDQLVKGWVIQNVGLNEVLPGVTNIFEIVYVKNTGAAFSILEDRIWILSIISVLFCIGVVIYWFWQKPQHPLCKTAIVMMFSGALGNAIDRVFRGFVVDFIKVTFINFPVFNIADIAITVGAALLILYVIFFDRSDQEERAA